MKSMSSRAVVAATLVMVVSLAIVLVLVLVLLAELYCSFLLRRRPSRRSLSLPTTSIPTAENPLASQSATPLNSFYSQGVLQPPRNFLFPSSLSLSNTQSQTKTKTHVPSTFQQDLDEPSSPELIREISIQPIVNNAENDKPTNCVCGGEDDFVCISNPIYSKEAISKPDTPFQTPDSSPSRLDMKIEICSSSSSSSKEEEIKTGGAADSPAAGTLTPPLTPMKELPRKACSVSLRDATSLETSASDSNSNNGGSSSSSGSPRNSPSW